MRQLWLLLLVVVLVATGAFLVGRLSVHGASTASSTNSTVPLKPPGEIHEAFTLLACAPATTIGIEGCTEHQILALDRRIVASERQLFSLLGSREERRRLLMSAREWILYRHSTCSIAADAYQGGTLAPVAFANCLVELDRYRASELTTTLKSYSPQ